MKIFTIIVGVLLLIAGFYSAVTPVSTFLTIGWLIGVVLLITGISLIIGYFQQRKNANVNAWDLLGGIITTAFALFVLYGQFARMVVDSFIIILFGIWVLVIGLIRIFSGLQLKKLGYSGWIWAIIIGIISVLMGIYGFMNPFVFKFAIGWMIGFILIMSGINILGFAFAMDSKKNRTM